VKLFVSNLMFVSIRSGPFCSLIQIKDWFALSRFSEHGSKVGSDDGLSSFFLPRVLQLDRKKTIARLAKRYWYFFIFYQFWYLLLD
jgi:hypothetical protein